MGEENIAENERNLWLYKDQVNLLYQKVVQTYCASSVDLQS